MFDVLKEEEKRKRDTHAEKIKKWFILSTSTWTLHLQIVELNLAKKMSAVEVRGGYKFYGKEKDPKIVLNRLNMTVTHGSM